MVTQTMNDHMLDVSITFKKKINNITVWWCYESGDTIDVSTYTRRHWKSRHGKQCRSYNMP